MRRLTATWGLPGSGKSTWAVEEKARYAAENFKAEIVCKDDIRAELEKTGWKWSPQNEKDVKRIQTERIENAFLNGCQLVISADTNFGGHLQRLRQLAKTCNAEFEVKDFTKVPLDECIRRDAAREKSVGAEVIKGMYYKYLNLPEVEPYVPDTSKPKAVICDIDGTVALTYKRSPYDYTKVLQDKTNDPVVELVKALNAEGYAIIYCSGREDSCYVDTQTWLVNNKLPVGPLYMRETGDHRKDFITKQEIFDKNIRKYYNVRFVIDDRTQVVKMWRRLGLTCLQCAEGDF
jgi:predicted kinase